MYSNHKFSLFIRITVRHINLTRYLSKQSFNNNSKKKYKETVKGFII